MDSSKDRLLQALHSSTIFSEANQEDLKLFAGSCEIRSVDPGEKIIHQNAVGDEMFVILDGRFQILIEDEGSEIETAVKELGPGEIVGELAALVDIRRIATVRAIGAGEIACIAASKVDELLQKSHSLTMCLLKAMARAASVSFQADAIVPIVDLDRYPKAASFRATLPERVIAACRAVPLRKTNDEITIGLVDPFDKETRRFLTQVVNPARPEFVGLSEENFKKLNSPESKLSETPPSESASATSSGAVYFTSQGSPKSAFESTPVDRFLTSVFQRAITLGATDIHFEPREDHLQARIRIDGNLVELPEKATDEIARNSVSRIKVLANLDITERRKSQSGSFTLQAGETVNDARVSTLVIRDGEKVAIRLIPTVNDEMLDLNFLIESKAGAASVQGLFRQPSGLILVTGPTGSGKTTTVYAGLESIWAASPVVNIVTIEDPIDRYLSYANQSQVDEKSGRSFAESLKSVLRQDPDVILIGEIRDEESGRIALEAANTGHLVIASVHSHFAYQAIARLRSLGIDPYLIATTLRGIISQRLVRKNCIVCREPLLSPEDNHDVRTLMQLGILDEDSFTKLQTGQGCDSCGGSGERFRTGLYEILGIDDELRGALYRGEPATPQIASKSHEFLSMATYAKFLLERGVISPRAAVRAFPHDTMIADTES